MTGVPAHMALRGLTPISPSLCSVVLFPCQHERGHRCCWDQGSHILIVQGKENLNVVNETTLKEREVCFVAAWICLQ